jgi:hypothetical protein
MKKWSGCARSPTRRSRATRPRRCMRRATSITTFLAAALWLPAAACSPGADDRGPSGADTAQDAGEPLTPGGAQRVPNRESHHFDPGAVEAGDTVLGLRVVRKDVRRVFEEAVWSGTVQFAGEITLTGHARRHFDYPEVDALCFWITDPESIQRIPDFAPDEWTSLNRQTWFCFANQEQARAQLGFGAAPQPATIVVDDYAKHRIFSDVFDTARLVRVLAIGGVEQREDR